MKNKNIIPNPFSLRNNLVGGAKNNVDNAFTILKSFDQTLSNNKLFLGLLMLTMNIGARYFSIHLSEAQEEYLRENIARELIIFGMVWTATRDLITALLVTISFVILADYLLNEDSGFCIIPKKTIDNIKFKKSRIKADGIDKPVTPEEEKHALEILNKVKRQKELETQAKFTSFFENNKD